MANIGAKQGCPLSTTLFGLYIDKLETYLDDIGEDLLCNFIDIVVDILLYANDVVLLSKSRECLKESSTSHMSYSLVGKLSKTKIMIFGQNNFKKI